MAKFCEKCGAEIKEQEKFCSNCGNIVKEEVIQPSLPVQQNENTVKPKGKGNGLSLAGFICALCGLITCGLTSIVGLILSCIGLSNSKKNNQKDGLAIAGIIISILLIIPSIIIFAISILGGINAKEVQVADFSLMSKEEARKWCDDNDITCYIKENYSNIVEEGDFIEQDVKPGEVIKSYSSITIYYSKGKAITISPSPSINPSPSITPSPSPADSPKVTANSITTKNGKYTLLEHYVSPESNEYAMYIEGKIQNNQNINLSYVQVTFTIYDAEGNTIGNCWDNQNYLDANGVWKFQAICSEGQDKIARYEFEDVTGW